MPLVGSAGSCRGWRGPRVDAESGAPEFALEQWFAANVGTWTCDLTGSGAPAIALADLLELADSEEREAWQALSLGYGPPEGSPELRAAIARRYRGIFPGDVIATCGAIEALRLAVDALVVAGDEVIVQEPSYPAVALLAAARGARIVPWRLDDASGHTPLAMLSSLLTPRTRLVAITQPNGPTGAALDVPVLERLGDLLAARSIPLLSDEVYRDLALDPDIAVPSSIGSYEHALAVGDVTKPFGLGGLRVGWIVVRDGTLRERIAALRDFTTLSLPTPSDVLARIALRHDRRLLREPLANARANLRALCSLVERSGALSFTPPRAGVTAFVRLADATRIQVALRDEGVLVVPGELFGRPDHLRIGLAGPPTVFTASLEHLERLLDR